MGEGERKSEAEGGGRKGLIRKQSRGDIHVYISHQIWRKGERGGGRERGTGS